MSGVSSTPPGSSRGGAPPPVGGAWVANPGKTAWWRRWWGIPLVVIGLLVPLGVLIGEPGDEPTDVAVGSERTGSETEPVPGPEADTEPEPPVESEPESEPEPEEEPAAEVESVPAERWTVVNVIDGDTIDVRSGQGTQERVRIIGIDTPERGECGYGEASEALANVVMGGQVELAPGARDDRDRYGRMLRYVDVGDLDVGLELLELGLAVARYDSRDGYGRHPREDEYVAADAAMVNIACEPEPSPEPSPTVEAAPATQIRVFRNCAELNQVYPGGVARTDVTGNTVSGALRPFGIQPHFDDELYAANKARDGDGDGIACEQ